MRCRVMVFIGLKEVVYLPIALTWTKKLHYGHYILNRRDIIKSTWHAFFKPKSKSHLSHITLINNKNHFPTVIQNEKSFIVCLTRSFLQYCLPSDEISMTTNSNENSKIYFYRFLGTALLIYNEILISILYNFRYAPLLLISNKKNP